MPHTRRSFLGRLARGLIATTIALELGAKLLPKAEAKAAPDQKLEINPEWVNAPYEIEYSGIPWSYDPNAPKYVWSEEVGNYVPWYDEAWDLVPWRITKHSRARA